MSQPNDKAKSRLGIALQKYSDEQFQSIVGATKAEIRFRFEMIGSDLRTLEHRPNSSIEARLKLETEHLEVFAKKLEAYEQSNR